jgi:hypothetical protein
LFETIPDILIVRFIVRRVYWMTCKNFMPL